MVRKTKEEALATRAQLLDAAQRVFCARGVSHTSLHEIATEAGLTRGAVYWHFENKTDLLAALWERVSLPLDAELDELEQKYAGDPLAAIEQKTLAVLQRVVDEGAMRDLMSILLLKCEYVPETESLRQHFVHMREGCLDKTTGEFQSAVDAGQLPASTNVRMAALGLYSLFDGCCFHWLISPETYDLMPLARTTIRAYLAGLQQQN